MKQDFLQHIQESFSFDMQTMQAFEACLFQPLKKSLRVNTNKISLEDFKQIAKNKGWVLTPTGYGKNTFYIDRTLDLDVSLGNTLEHIGGYFYIQEVAASTSPYYLSGDSVDQETQIILDMSAAPGGKSTQLAEYYPNSLIIANEVDKTRLKALEENIDRMGAKNIFVTNYDGRHFKNTPEVFDKILLDAPCSGEGTSFKTEDALKFWNLKNIEKIALLQLQLLESALISLKVGGEMVYSTCTLNKLENEGVIEKVLALYPESIEIIGIGEETFQRNWPHIQKTGGFFVAKLRKIAPITSNHKTQKTQRQNIEKLQNKQEKMIADFLEKHFGYVVDGNLFQYKNDIFYAKKGGLRLWEEFFFYKMGIHIGTLKGGVYEPGFFLGTLDTFHHHTLNCNAEEISQLLAGKDIAREEKDGFYQVIGPDSLAIGIAKLKTGKLKSLLPTKMTRKS